MTSELDRVLEPGYLGDLAVRTLDEIRVMRAECQEVETGLSYLRRLIQGRSDIIAAEAASRSGGSAPVDLISRLPEVLAEHSRTAGKGRLPQTLGTGTVDPDLEAELDHAVPLKAMSDLDIDALTRAADLLADLEGRVSGHRRALFDRLDALQTEIARRYRTGEASVENLLP